ncbi:MAG TPA: hypothetical protein VHE30_18245 [Polyangiaceae bacterium]|nr:hypothetical protein [Polyangiaceae bacterium]
MDPAGLPALLQTIRHVHGVDATWMDSVPVSETFEGRVLWEGHVQVFAVQHPRAKRVYAWSEPDGDRGRRRVHAVLGAGPVEDARTAVRVETLGG